MSSPGVKSELADVLDPRLRSTGPLAEAARAKLLASFSHSANLSVPDVRRLLPLLAERVSDLIGDACTISLVSDDGEHLDLVALRCRNPEHLELGARLLAPSSRLDGGTDSHVIRTGETFFVRHVHHPEELPSEAEPAYRSLSDQIGIHSRITAPLLVRGRVIGTTTVARLSPGSPYTDADRVFLEELADRAALAIDNARLYAARLETEASLRDSEDRLRRAAETARARAAQQAAVAELGHRALSELDLDALLAAAARAVADSLGDDYTEVAELIPGGDELRLRAGVGWKPGLVGSARVPAGRRSHAGYTLLVGQPVVVEDLARERRFTPSPLLVDHGVVSGASVIISLDSGPYGVLSTYSSQLRSFSADEVNFLHAVANLLAVAMVRHRSEELRGQAEQQNRLAAIGQLAAGVAHDFNNIVSAISVSAQLLESQPGLDQKGREQVGHIRREAERGASMIWQILDFAHRGPIARAPVDLDQFFADLPLLRQTRPGEVSIRFQADSAEHQVMGDVGRLEQIMTNLATNASDAIPAAGRIDITLSREDVTCEPGSPVPGMVPGPWVRIAFSDTGTGIPPDVLPRIFEPFFSTKPSGHGTGLGLAQVYGLVSQHDGHIDVTSTPGQGTTATMWIPAVGSGGPAGKLLAQPPRLPGPGPAALTVPPPFGRSQGRRRRQ